MLKLMTSKGKADQTIKLNRQAKTISLDTFELTDSASRNMLISKVKQMFGRGTLRTLASAEALTPLPTYGICASSNSC